VVCKYIYSIYLRPICHYNILHIIYDKNIEINNIKIISLKKCVTNNIDANTKIQKLGNSFLNAQQMVVQLDAYLVLSLPLYHSF
jgi:hypothetical protein